jgi:hypothetical protein
MTYTLSLVIVNGRKTKLPHIICKRCCHDTTVPGIRFDKEGVCNFCHLYDKLAAQFPLGAEGERLLEAQLAKVRKAGQGRKFDCILGISGGRDSSWLLWRAVKDWGLRPLAVHFNDGFANPVAGENMVKACRKLGVELRTVTSDWNESKDIRIAFLKASTPDLNIGTDLGLAAALYGVASKEGIRHILIGQSFRTEGIKPLSWSYFDGDYLRNVHARFGTRPLRPWKPDDPGFNLGMRELFHYTIRRRIRTLTPLYFTDYQRPAAEEILKRELGWVYPGAHYFDDLYHALVKYVHRVKFNIDLNMNSDAALVLSGQMSREKAIEEAHSISAIEDPKVISLCIKRLGLTQEEFEEMMKLKPKEFRDYKTSYSRIRLLRLPIWLASRMRIVPQSAYDKYFNCGS